MVEPEDCQIIPHSSPALGPEEQQAVAGVLASGHLTQGVQCRNFEDAVAAKIGTDHACAVSSGLAALHLACLAMDVADGDEVIVPSLVCEALLHAIVYCGGKPVIVDVDPCTGNIAPEAAGRALTARTRLVMVPHMFGTPADIDRLLALGVPVLEDCALAIGAEHSGRKLGSFGAMSVFSFYATKVLCAGEGGMVLTDDEQVAERIRDLRDYGGRRDFHMRFNYKLTDIAAAMGNEQLKKLDGFIRRRREIASLYDRSLSGMPSVEIPAPSRHVESIYYRYVVRVPPEWRGEVRDRMRRQGVECGLGVLNPLHTLLPEAAPRSCPVAGDWAERSLSLPIYPTLADAQVHRVVEALREAMRGIASERSKESGT